ncbi:MAG: zinc-ribbon domain-containing protein [Sphingomonas fennica]
MDFRSFHIVWFYSAKSEGGDEMICSQCNASIATDSKFCSNCGASQAVTAQIKQNSEPQQDNAKRGGKAGRKVGIALAIVLFFIVMIAISGGSQKTDTSLVSASSENLSEPNAATDAVNTLDDRGEPAGMGSDASAGVSQPSSPWSYSEDEDKMHGGKSYFATTTSTNSIRQDSPYDAETTMRMTVRRMPSSGTDVVFTVSSGQLMCPSYEGCSGMVRFDTGSPERISFNGPADNSSDTIFVVGAKRFIGKLKNSKKLLLEKTMYNAGDPQFEFDVSGLKWEH